MNIGQIMRNQQMLYAIANKSVDMSGSGYPPKPASSSSKLSAYSSLLNGFGSSAQDTGDNFFSSPAALQGTVRQIARRVYDASFSSGAIAGEDGTGSVQGSGFSGGDELLKAIQKQLGTKVESQRQIYQPDQTGLTGDCRGECRQPSADGLPVRRDHEEDPGAGPGGREEQRRRAGERRGGYANRFAGGPHEHDSG